MNQDELAATLTELNIPGFIRAANESTLARTIADQPSGATEQPHPERLPRYAFLYEAQGVTAYKQWAASTESTDLVESRRHFDAAFACWQALATLNTLDFEHGSLLEGPSATGLEVISAELRDEPIGPRLTMAFRLAVSGLIAQRPADVRLELTRFNLLHPEELDQTVQPLPWANRVASQVLSSVSLLVRKQNGWEDIDSALASIEDLRQLQSTYEEQYLTDQGPESNQAVAAVELVGLYHLAQLVTVTGEYLRDGDTASGNLRVRLDRHHSRAIEAFEAGRWALLAHLADLCWAACRELAQNAIWTHLSNLSESSQRFARLLASRGRPRPVLELWPSQQVALGENLLDPYRKAILVEMPTSAGKTLLAKFAIVQTQTLNPSGTIAYVVPTRALVNQVTFDLRADFQELGFRIEQAVPAFELDPMETRLLQTPPTVLVTTPEKLDLLVRRDHPAAQNLTLVIADEAHNLDDRNRGPRLELLLGTIKRDRPGARFLLLSPFLPNDEELVTWLGEERRLPPIKVDWKPGRKIVGSVNVLGRASNRHLVFETLPAADNADLPSGMQIVLGPPAPKTVKGITKATVESAVERGSVLVLCGGPDSAMTRASELAEDMPDVDVDQYMTAVIHYLDAEIGRPSLLTQCLRRGVAYHHSGLSQEARWLVEGLIRRGSVRIVCGTTTLAQGVNFPITTVVVESLRKGRDSELSYADFWNIAGRAGRALVDTVGLIAFPAPDAERRRQYETFLQGEAQEISSQLARLIDRADEIEDSFSLSTIERWPELSSLLQFLAHAMKVSGKTQVAEDVEDLLRASLVYHQARRDSEERAQRLVDLCRSYLLHIEDRADILPLADQTGFATPSVLALLSQRSNLPELTYRANWKPANLFGENLSTLTLCIQSISGLPEIQLSEGRGRPFDPQRVAAILRDWVQGATLEQLTSNYSLENPDTPTDKRIAHFTRYLFSTLLGQASWGLGALETVYLGDTRDTATSSANEEGYVPSMVFFGVHQPEAVWMRMVGVPRVVANGVATLWRQSQTSEPESFQELRGWVDQLTDAAWTQAIPTDSQLTASDMKLLWHDFVGAGADVPA